MIESKARAMANSMDFAFLLDRERNLLSIGYSVTDGQLDRAAMTCLPLKLDSRASSPSRSTTCRRNTGSALAAT